MSVISQGGFFDVQHAQDQDRSARQRHAENSAREASSSFTFDTEGVGSIIVANPIRFDATFLEKPRVSTGVEIIKLPNRTIYEMPHVTTGVMRWLLDEKKYYIGAYVWARVWCDPVLDELTGNVLDQEAVDQNPPKPVVRHHMTVNGVAYKKLPGNITSTLVAE